MKTTILCAMLLTSLLSLRPSVRNYLNRSQGVIQFRVIPAALLS